MKRPVNVKMATAISDADWELALDATEMMGGWLDYLFAAIPGVGYQLWLARTYAYARGMQDERKAKRGGRGD